MPVVSLFKLSQLDGLLNRRLGEIQDARVSRQILKRSSDLMTYTSTRYKNWNITSGLTIFVNKVPLLSEDTKYTITPSRETLTIFDANGCPQQKSYVINIPGSIKFEKPLKTDDFVEAEFSFRMYTQEDLHALLYDGLLEVQRRMYMDFDPAMIPSAVTEMVVTAALLKFNESMNTEASFLYTYKVQDQMHDKNQVSKNFQETIKLLNLKLDKDARQALWRIGNGRARSVVSVKQRYIPSSSLRGYNGTHEDGI